ncbi:hypothetical protein [Bifidobacterium olomucense]|uniref:Phage tail protein n=1 Tax=Bifidobacterium olomucense TaxID=2675324 RepID=A0A7Y0HWB2_9BIFI|nr:hypothetical protein [Bifidobacterium sp. DSM 109959]NMM98161.1 hypothetical protein [Bifidobacterium sp. DSM 109959]
MTAFMELSVSGYTVRLDGDGINPTGLYVTSDGVEGWYGTPDLKIQFTERGQGDGAHDVPESDAIYSARTVTVHYGCVGLDRADALQYLMRVQRFAHRMVTVRVVDGGMDTYCQGYVSSTVTPTWDSDYSWDDTLTIVCARPERLSWDAHRFQLLPTRDGNGGLFYGDSAPGLVYPLSYGKAASDARNVGVLLNNGSSRAYPVFTVYGSFPNGVELQFTGRSSLRLDRPVGAVPVVLDSRSATATLAGQDVSRSLTARGFPVVQPYSSLSVSLQSAGTGYVDCLIRDTYM